MKRSTLVRSLFFVFLLPANCFAAADPIKVPATQLNQLVDSTIKIYDLELDFIGKFSSVLNKRSMEAGEGLYRDLFNDPIRLFQQLLLLDKNHPKAHLYLGHAFQQKSYEGEGAWNKDLLTKAKEHYRYVLDLAKKTKIDGKVIEEARSELEEVEKILASYSKQ
jgi:hypothetical protein